MGSEMCIRDRYYDTMDAEQPSEIARSFDSLNVAIICTDLRGRVVVWNQHIVQLSGYSKEWAIGRSLPESCVVDTFQRSVAHVLSDACRGANIANVPCTLVAEEGQCSRGVP